MLCRSVPNSVLSTLSTGHSCRHPFALVGPRAAARVAVGPTANSSSAWAMGAGSIARTAPGEMSAVVAQPDPTNPTGSAGPLSGLRPATSITTLPTASSRTSPLGASAVTCCTTGLNTADGPPSPCCCAEPWATCSSDLTGSKAAATALARSVMRFIKRSHPVAIWLFHRRPWGKISACKPIFKTSAGCANRSMPLGPRRLGSETQPYTRS